MKEHGLPVRKFTGFNFQKISWMSGLYLFQLFHQALRDASRISCSFEEFQMHFTVCPEFPIGRIVYNGSGTELITLFIELDVLGRSIRPVNMHDLLCDHFVNVDGSDFNPDSLKTFSSPARGRSKKVQKFLDVIFSEMSKRKSA